MFLTVMQDYVYLFTTALWKFRIQLKREKQLFYITLEKKTSLKITSLCAEHFCFIFISLMILLYSMEGLDRLPLKTTCLLMLCNRSVLFVI